MQCVFRAIQQKLNSSNNEIIANFIFNYFISRWFKSHKIRNIFKVCEVLDLLILLLELPSKKDQIYLLMYEPSMAELLYVLLTKKDYSVDLKEKI